ncbi:MAG: hypothetical protein JWR80_7407 [Bradyrhizobium sp.]|nr:hypothetical protein [Bradyrhizobium sp.]
MRVDLYTLCWNEADILGFFFRHYDPVVTRYIVYDDGSTDGSLDILRRHPRVEIRQFERSDPNSFVLSQQHLQNSMWKESRGYADWIIITALDEHLTVPRWRLDAYLAAAGRAGVTAIPALGFQMLSDALPPPDARLATSRTIGAPWSAMSKLSIFDPEAIDATGFTVGRHEAQPIGRIHFPQRDELMLLHYKYIGFERTLKRHQDQNSGLGTTDISSGWAVQYRWDEAKLRAEWDTFAADAVDIARANFDPLKVLERPRWWRPPDFVDAKPRLAHRLGMRSGRLAL